MIATIREFLRLESASGILLIVATAFAMLIVNSPAGSLYDALIETPVEVRIGAFEIAKPLLLWINDGLMAIFFFLVGLELKREIVAGELSKPSQVVLPFIGAIGGMSIPALIYIGLNWDNEIALKGWAIPSATDIAFALGVLSLLGNRVPHSLKLFLLTLAIIDDLGAIIIIALFYSGELSLLALSFAAVSLLGLTVLNRSRVVHIAPYIVVGIVLWIAVLKSGVHATLAGVLLAMFIPVQGKNEGESPLRKLEHDLHPTVAFGILPVFAFANTGVSFDGFSVASLLQPVPLGIALGLFVGNQIGVFGLTWVAVKSKLAELPAGVTWRHMYGVSAICGIGFTMSLFISSLAFEKGGSDIGVDDRIGILVGSLFSAVFGYLVLRTGSSRERANDSDV